MKASIASDGKGGQRPVAARYFLALAAAVFASPLSSQEISSRPYQGRDLGYTALHQAALDAGADTLVLILASHPDDSYVIPAAYLRFRFGWRVSILLATRGEGGQNSSGPQTGDDLGRLRTLEAEHCAARLDARVFYLNCQDAGYSRSARETLQLWDEERTTRNMARLFRKIRPDIVLTAHHPAETHGHDTALLQILPQAVVMAADEEALPGLPPIRINKVYRGAAPGEAPSDLVELPIYEHDHFRGQTYRRLGYSALLEHHSQEPIRPMEDLTDLVIRLISTAPWAGPSSFTGGLRSLFDDLPETTENAQLKRDLLDLSGSLDGPTAVLNSALDLRSRLLKIPPSPGTDREVRVLRRMEALDRLVLQAAGLRIDAQASPGEDAVPDKDLHFQLRLQNTTGISVEQLSFESSSAGEVRIEELSSEESRAETLQRLCSDEPVFLNGTYHARADIGDHQEWVQRLFTVDSYEPPVRLRCLVTLEGHQIDLPLIVPVEVRPPVELEVRPRALLIPRGGTEVSFTAVIHRNTPDPLEGKLRIEGRAGFVVRGAPVDLQLDKVRSLQRDFKLRVPEDLAPGVYNLHVELGDLTLKVPVHKVDVSVPRGLTVGLIQGVDDTAKSVLRGLVGSGLQVLDEEELAVRPLGEFSTILIDIRALREREKDGRWKAARAAFPRLLEYVEEGGRLVVLYHKDSEYNIDSAGFRGWPYRLEIGKGRVTQEDAPVEALLPEHVLLNIPNEIRAQDWDGWVQERGLYFPQSYAPEFQELLAMSDRGQETLKGSLLYATYGKGEFVYCALALYRQLKFLHPGACRIFCNLVAR